MKRVSKGCWKLGVRRVFDYKGTVQDNVLGVMELFCILTMVAAIQLGAFVRMQNYTTVCKFKTKVKI